MRKMKHIYSGILFIAGLLALSSCDKSGTEIREEGGVITISLSSAELQTRAPMDGEDAFNENAIKRIDWFLYEKDKTSGQAAKSGRVDNLNATGQETIRVNVTEDELNKHVFPKSLGKKDCDVFLIVNLPDGVDISGTSVAELEALVVSADFASGTQDSFVMTGSGVATIVDRKKILAASGTIKVDRVASKVSLTAKVANSIEIEADGKTWVSDPSNMKIRFFKGQNTAVLSGDPAPAAVDASNFDYAKRTYTQRPSEESGYTIWKGDPFYSYPKSWNSGNKDEEPYLLIELPWSSEGGATTTFRSCYYKVFLNSEELVRNTWYDITLTLSVLGSFIETEPKVMIKELQYKVCDWSSFEFSAEIQAARYLVVDQNEYVMNNVDTLRIPFLTSHECELVDVKVEKKNIKDKTGNSEVPKSDYTCRIDDTGACIVYGKKLDNVYSSSTFDFVPYIITLTIWHKDNTNFNETITIKQYPAIYGLDYENSDYSNDKSINGDNGFVFVNGYQGSSAKEGQDFFCTANGMRNAYGGASPNMYVFTVTNVKGTDYIIGDPRETNVSDIVDNAKWYSAQHIDQNGNINAQKRELKDYYATDASARTQNMVAPKFRVASAYAVLDTGDDEARSLDYMKKRCASYQEDGYPAGRWRLPTKAEFSLIFSQVNRRNLPPIYEVGSKYWCAHGLGEPQSNGTVKVTEADRSGHSVRCVYDEWYWGSEQLKDRTKFTWGDMPR